MSNFAGFKEILPRSFQKTLLVPTTKDEPLLPAWHRVSAVGSTEDQLYAIFGEAVAWSFAWHVRGAERSRAGPRSSGGGPTDGKKGSMDVALGKMGE